MTDHDALLAAVLANPDDDLPRLVFADFLEESGHPANVARAHFIRAQVEAARHDTGSAEALRLLAVAEEYRPSFRDEADAVVIRIRRLSARYLFRCRGFVEELRGPARALLSGGGRVSEVAPVRGLELDCLTPHRRALNRATWLTRVREFRPFRGSRVVQTDAFLSYTSGALFNCPHLSGLATLHLSGLGLTDNWMVSFVRRMETAAFAATLRVLNLSTNHRLTDAAASALAAARGFDYLTSIRLAYCGITPAGAIVLRRRFGDRVVL